MSVLWLYRKQGCLLYTSRGLKYFLIFMPCATRVVAPHAGAWIEIQTFTRSKVWFTRRSPRGSVDWNIKHHDVVEAVEVAPHAGAWIEIISAIAVGICSGVAPHAGAWIEMHQESDNYWVQNVAPHAGAWIEILVPLPHQWNKTVAPHAGAVSYTHLDVYKRQDWGRVKR